MEDRGDAGEDVTQPGLGIIDYWLINPTGADYEAGRKLADEYLAYLGEHPTNGNTTRLTCIVHEMIDRASAGQKWSGVHVGFLAGVNRYAMAAAGGLCGR
jgi:hypothetical protein